MELNKKSVLNRRPVNGSTRIKKTTNTTPAPQASTSSSSQPAPNVVTRQEPKLEYHPKDPFQIQHALSMQTSLKGSLTRDFIHDSLYNSDYGYFSKRALIFSYPQDIDFTSLKSSEDFHHRVAELYQEYDEAEDDAAAQVWHTPTELFKPWYGYAIGEYILREHLQKSSNRPLILYEMGAGNGTLMCNILEHIQRSNPRVYASMQYNVIEISKQLTERQEWNNMSKLAQEARKHKNVRIINRSIFDWTQKVDDECFFIALEVIV